MEKNTTLYRSYVDILTRELIPAMGCTEPIAIAYCAAAARAKLGRLPEKAELIASGNIIKNVKSVVVPNTGGRRGMKVACAIGILGGDENALLQVIAKVPPETVDKLEDYIAATPIEVKAGGDYLLDVTVRVWAGEESAAVRVAEEHTNIVYIEKNGAVEYENFPTGEETTDVPDYDLLTVEKIVDFADTCELSDVEAVLDRQIDYNTAIAREGLTKAYGANVGKVLLRCYGDSVKGKARAWAAAASDARMNGCELPVVINSGSGNQGITASLPVIQYALETGASREQLLRALLVSNLTTIHEKTGIGRLSAYCGAVSAGAGAGAGIAYLLGGGFDAVAHTVVNALAVTSGIVCDGAKSSCAAKIAAAVEAGIMGYEMYLDGNQFYGGDGLVEKGVENSIRAFGRLGRVGMAETDKEIIRMMTGE